MPIFVALIETVWTPKCYAFFDIMICCRRI